MLEARTGDNQTTTGQSKAEKQADHTSNRNDTSAVLASPPIAVGPGAKDALKLPIETTMNNSPRTTKISFANPLTSRARQLCGATLLLAALALGNAQAQTVSVKMVNIPAGSFMMGSCAKQSAQDAFLGNAARCTPQDPDADNNETPRHLVNVSAFQLAKTEVTLGQFKAYIKATGRTSLVDGDFIKHNNQGDNAPVVWVSWDDAQGFIAWMNQTQGGGWRLPTEAEWEYACRAGGQHKYCGSDSLGEVAWYDGNSGGAQRTVGTKRANAFGLFDMNGNVREWTQDCWNDSYQGAPNDGSAWIKDYCPGRVTRGASWYYPEGGISRAAFRSGAKAGYRNPGYGFRLARTRSK
jgi:formylglycine-generating enzyme required for sulfatase activity